MAAQLCRHKADTFFVVVVGVSCCLLWEVVIWWIDKNRQHLYKYVVFQADNDKEPILSASKLVCWINGRSIDQSCNGQMFIHSSRDIDAELGMHNGIHTDIHTLGRTCWPVTTLQTPAGNSTKFPPHYATYVAMLSLNVKVQYLIQRCLHESDSWPEELYNLGSGSWLAWANDIAAHYAAIHCLRQWTTGPVDQPADIAKSWMPIV